MYISSKCYIYECEVIAEWLDQRDQVSRAAVGDRLEGLFMTRLFKGGCKWMTYRYVLMPLAKRITQARESKSRLVLDLMMYT